MLWPALLLGALPLAGLMPWTGWVTVEEFDLAVLAVAAGGYLRMAARPLDGGNRDGASLGPVLLCVLPLAVSVLLSMQRGIADAGGLQWGWWQGYREPLNAVRLAKSLFEVCLLLPLWQMLLRANTLAATRSVTLGMLAMLTGLVVVVLWERLAFTGLLNFSSDYRVTGPFWEMHVGGAALDAALAASMPFAVAALAAARTPGKGAALALLVAAGLYAALVTFSRVMLLAVPLGLLTWWLLSRWQGAQSADSPQQAGRWPAAIILVAFAALAAWMFPSSGYRGLLGLLGSLAVSLPLPGLLRGNMVLNGRPVLAATAIGVVSVAVWCTLAPRSAYALFALSGLLAAGLMVYCRRLPWPARVLACLAASSWAATLAASVALAAHWGGPAAAAPAAGAALVLVLAVVANLGRVQTLWPTSWRWQLQTVVAAVVLASVGGVLLGGDYLRHRMSAVSEDSGGRQAHWSRSLELLGAGDWWLGKGLGRYAANRALSGNLDDQTGDYRLIARQDGGQAVALSSGKQPEGWAQTLRFSQRMASPAAGPVVLELNVRVDQPMQLGADICEKHLIYAGACVATSLDVKPVASPWQRITLKLAPSKPGAPALTGGAWYAPRLTVFSVQVSSTGQRVEIDDLRLTDAYGKPLLRNGDFERGLAHWFISSDRKHLPWHAKNLGLHLLIEQGVAGLLAFVLLVAVALWRVSLGAARRHALAPLLGAALLSMLVVGMVDSLLDMPRISFMLLLLAAAALMLRSPPAGALSN